MNSHHKKRLSTIIFVLLLLAGASGLILYALKQNINVFFTPTELRQAHLHPYQIIRLGGYVKKNSIHYDPNGINIHFLITDKQQQIMVYYAGILPTLFREGQSVVVTGYVDPKAQFQAKQILAKHDEKYMPAPLAAQLKSEGKL